MLAILTESDALIILLGVVLQLHKQLDAAAERLSLRHDHSGVESSAPLQRQMDLEVELLERKVRLFMGRAELIAKRDQPTPRDVQVP